MVRADHYRERVRARLWSLLPVLREKARMTRARAGDFECQVLWTFEITLTPALSLRERGQETQRRR
jgi:hypothetical protein